MTILSRSRNARRLLLALTGFLIFGTGTAQTTVNLGGGAVSSVTIGGVTYAVARPTVSYMIGDRAYTSSESSPLSISTSPGTAAGSSLTLTFLNTSKDTLHLRNVLPFAPGEKDIYITGKGTHRLSRTHLFQPGRLPVNVIVPDNAWELGYVSFPVGTNTSLFGLTRRDSKSVSNAKEKRFETIINPGGSVSYWLYSDVFTGNWQEGLRKCFQEKKLYDLTAFDESLYKREDLQWVRKAYVMHLMMAWDKDYYDAATGRFNWTKFNEKGRKLYGGDDVLCVWPTWPTLGLDKRNQFDLYRDLPGGLKTLRALADTMRQQHVKLFIAYNPWDESTRSEGHLQGLAYLIRETSADGVVLDTKGESSRELQEAADKVRAGVIMYSEGMAVPKDMPNIVSGRVHNALYYPPMLNLNKLIRPDFAIFRVAEVYKEPIQREYAVSFFNGYGTEINQFAPGHPEYEEEQYRYLGRTSRILRENSSNFLVNYFVPLVQTLRDSVWVNRWPSGDKTIFTVLSLKPEGYKGPLLEVAQRNGFHWVDLWKHQEIKLVELKGTTYAAADIDSFNQSYLGTNNEGQVTCLAELPVTLNCKMQGYELLISSSKGNEIRVYQGNPAYDKNPVTLAGGSHSLDIREKFGRHEGKLVVQAFDGGELVDELVVYTAPGTARLVSRTERTSSVAATDGMVKIPAGKFQFKATQGDAFIPYPAVQQNVTHDMQAFWMDRFPVTNTQFKAFLDAAKYKPTDTANFLKHWKGGRIPKGEERFPVVYVSYEDAIAYAQWAGKRLPAEIEWQYAAQTDKLNEWPWKQTKPVTRKEQFVTETLTVSALEGIDASHCNLGDGKPYAVGRYPKGANPFGLQDLVGCVWQLTNDVYESGSYRGIILKGGSFFKPSSSWWYVQGGPRELHYRQYLLRVSQGFERNATVGFRCMRD